MEQKMKKDERFEEIYDAYADEIYKLSVYYTKDEQVSQEIVQNTFMKLYVHMDNMKLDYVRAWLIRVARNLIYNHSRDSKYEMMGEVIELVIERKETVPSLEECYIRREQKSEINALCDNILGRLAVEHEEWYEAIVLVYCMEKSREEAAYELGITLDTLHGRLYRAKQWIDRYYKKKYKKIRNGLA